MSLPSAIVPSDSEARPVSAPTNGQRGIPGGLLSTRGLSSTLKLRAKSAFFPGLDLHTRDRLVRLSPYILSGDLGTLDVGFGNGALALAAVRKGNRVTGLTISQRELDSTRDLFRFRGVPEDRYELLHMNAYDLDSLDGTFDQIICSEMLEHVSRDAEMVGLFRDRLKPSGRLLLCCPNSLHPDHALGRTANPETGGHVRDGYTLGSYRALLEPCGFKITAVIGVGSQWLVGLDRILRAARNRAGDLLAFPLFLCLVPLTSFDVADPQMPFSLAIVAERP